MLIWKRYHLTDHPQARRLRPVALIGDAQCPELAFVERNLLALTLACSAAIVAVMVLRH
jgi:hypothetical protein